MIDISLLWIPFTLLGAAGQVARNAMQSSLTGVLGTVGATHIRFLFGFPFAVLFLAAVLIVGGEPLPRPSLVFWPWLVVGALAQIAATALMLAAMRERSFVVTTAYLKTEAVQTAIFGLIFLGDGLTLAKTTAIMIATLGVIVTAWRPGKTTGLIALRPILLGLCAAALFAIASVAFRGAILSLSGSSFVSAASFSLTVALFVQALVLTLWLLARDRAVLVAIFRLWKPSLLAGFLGAFASLFWFLGFAVTSAANVRTLALIEVVFAQGVSHYSFKQKIVVREMLGIAMIVIGVALLIAAH